MPLKSLANAKQKTIGTKQTLKAVEKAVAKLVFVADDADEHVIRPILNLSNEKGIPVFKADTMKNLGKACGIEVGCATAAILKE